MGFVLTQGNMDDRKLLKSMDFHKRIFGKLFGDKEYISRDLFEQLFINGVDLITKIKNNMMNALMVNDKFCSGKEP
ncbi:MAG: transposase [Arachidicoccus sp.]|nr:transposase [Arachidicoccus sp.]